MPFSCSQNLQGDYTIMVQTFICTAKVQVLKRTNETRNIMWISLEELRDMLDNDKNSFYPMHVNTLKKYLALKIFNHPNLRESQYFHNVLQLF